MSTPTPPPPPPPPPAPDQPAIPASAVPQKPVKEIRVAPLARLSRAKDLLGDQYMLFVGICFVAMLIGGAVPLGILMGPMMCGLFICYRQRMLGQPSGFEPLFKGFDHFVDSLIAILIYFGISIVAMIPLVIIYLVAFVGILAGAQANEAAFLLMIPLYLVFYLLLFAVSSAIYVPFTYVFPLIVDRGMSGVDACKASWALARPMFLQLFGMYFLYMCLSLVCTLACFVPVLFFAPLAIGAAFTLYQDVCGIKGLRATA